MIRTGSVKDVAQLYENDDKNMNIFTMSLGKDYTYFNLVNLYRQKLLDDAISISFTNVDIDEYDMNPRVLAKALFKSTDMFFIINQINGFREDTEMNLRDGVEVLVPSVAGMNFLKRMFLKLSKERGDFEVFQ